MFWHNPIHILCDVLKPFTSPISIQKFIFYEGNMHTHIHISRSKHETLYLIYYDQSCNTMFTTHEESMHTSISCFMKENFRFISVLYKYISILHKSYISLISYHIIWTHEIDNMLIKDKLLHMLNTIPKSRNTYLYMIIMEHIKNP